MYEYNATLMRTIDGDTVVLRVDLGFKIWAEMSFRLIGINAPELNQLGGVEAKAHLSTLIGALGPVFRIATSKPDKYGRWLVTFPTPHSPSVNEQMVLDGHAVGSIT